MRDKLDEWWSQLSYYVDEVLIRIGLARDDPAVDLRRRALIGALACVVIVSLGGWWYTTHVLVSHQPEPTHATDPAPLPVSSGAASTPVVDTPATTSAAAPSAAESSECDPNYSPCIPNVAGDLNCGDIRQTVRVIGADRYDLDNDLDGYGCDSYSN